MCTNVMKVLSNNYVSWGSQCTQTLPETTSWKPVNKAWQWKCWLNDIIAASVYQGSSNFWPGAVLIQSLLVLGGPLTFPWNLMLSLHTEAVYGVSLKPTNWTLERVSNPSSTNCDTTLRSHENRTKHRNRWNSVFHRRQRLKSIR